MIVEKAVVTNPKMKDERRIIKELDKTAQNFSVQVFEVLSDAGPLGKHAHARKTETFVIVSGSGVLLACAVDEKGNKLGEIQRYELEAGHVVRVEPYEAHTFYLEPKPGETKMVCYSSAAFDVTDFIQCPWLVEGGTH